MEDKLGNIDFTSVYDVSKQIVDIVKQNYAKEISSNSKLAQFTWNVEFENSIYQLVFHLPPEWYWVEYGRRPGPVGRKGLESIMQWMEVRGMVQRGSNNKIPQKVWAVAKKIEKKGFYGRNGEHHGKHILMKSINEADYLIKEICDIITMKLNGEVRTKIIDIFSDLNSFKIN